MTNYYNEFDPYAAQWLRNLIGAALIPAGHVDERSIADVRSKDVAGFTQCHFFAGLGGWSRALWLAEWPEDREVWTGSCPCQPFSLAGQQRGLADERHLWPEFKRLIGECRPSVVFGEQVASASAWLALVRSDLEALGYAMGAMPIEAASAGANHKRDRYWFVAHSDKPCQGKGWQQRSGEQCRTRGDQEEDHESLAHSNFGESGAQSRDDAKVCGFQETECQPEHSSALPRRRSENQTLADAKCDTGVAHRFSDTGESAGRWDTGGGIVGTDVADAYSPRLLDNRGRSEISEQLGIGTVSDSSGDDANSDCKPSRRFAVSWGERGNWRVEPDVGRLAHGIPCRVGKLRALGNAIVPQVAAEFIAAYMECRP